MDRSLPNRFRAAALRALPLCLLAAAACSDRAAPVDPVNPPTAQQQRGTVRCDVQVASRTITCADATPASGGARFNRLTVGEQGMFVRLASSNLTNAGGVFAFNTTVQNLSSLPFATADGTTRHNDGVRVFFADAPAVTSGTGSVAIANPTGQDAFTEADQYYYQYGGQISSVDQGELGADGILASGETSAAKNWQFTISGTVNSFTFLVFVSTETPSGDLTTIAPQITSVSPNPLVPGSTATITGTGFSATPASNTVTIGGLAATVTAATATELQVTVPCVATGSVAVQATTTGYKGVAFSHPLQVAQVSVPLGQRVLVTNPAQVACSEIAASGTTSKYVVAVYNTNASPTSNAPFQFSADAEGAAPAQLQQIAASADLLSAVPARFTRTPGEVSEARHTELLEKNRAAFERLRAEYPAGDARMRRRSNRVSADPVEPPLTRTIRVSNINATSPNTICSSFYVANATRVYYTPGSKVAIYEDDATPTALKAANNAQMADYYQKIGDQFNADMEPIISANFGNPLARDADTDNNGVVVAFFTPRINTSFSGVAGFVVSCDQFPNNDTTTAPVVGGPQTGSVGSTNGASNHGQYFYAYQPTATGTGYASFTPDSWYWSIRATFIHETKHIVSQATRVTNGSSSYEASWLEEGTARHAEELWARNSVYNVAWKANTGYGSAAAPGSIYCDWRRSASDPGGPDCLATNPRRPSLNMYRHFQSLYTFLANPRLLSPFGATPSDNSSYFYAISWSLARYAIDRYGASDAAFLSTLTNSTQTGITNLAGRAGVSVDELLGGWALAMYADDYPGLASPSADIQFPTWNMRDIYNGTDTDPLLSFSLNWPVIVSGSFSFGSVAPVNFTTLRGGSVAWFEFSGNHTQPQLLRLLGSAGVGLPASTVRLAIARVE